MLSRLSSRLPLCFSFAKIQGYPHVSDKLFTQYYKNNEQQMAMHFTELSKLGLKPTGIVKLFKQKPTLFKSEQKDLQIKDIITNLKSKYGAKSLPPISIYPSLMEGDELQGYIEVLRKYKFTEQQIERIFIYQPQALTERLEFRLKGTISMLTNYFHMNEQECNATITKFPFILMVRHHRYIESAKFLISRGVKMETVKEMFFKNIYIFEMGVNRLKMLFEIPERWGVKKDLILKIVLENIDYLAQCPNQMIFKKINIMNNFKIPQRIAKIIFEKYPGVLISSIQSLDAKLILINQKLKIPLEVSELFPYLLSKNYNGVLRPRAELILKYGLELNKQQFDVSDEEFWKNNNVPEEVFQAEKKKYKITNERDIKKKFYTNSLRNILKEEGN